MVQRYYNPFASTALLYPEDQSDYYKNYIRQRSTSVDHSPFPRMVDLWWVGLALAARQEMPPESLANRSLTHFENGQILDRDSWRVQFLMLLALRITGEIEIVTRPTEIVSIANGLAATGVPLVINLLQESNLDPIWNLTEALKKMLSEES